MAQENWFDALLGSLLVFIVLWKRRLVVLFGIFRIVRSCLKFIPAKRGLVMENIGIENIEIMICGVASLTTAVAALIDNGPGVDDIPAVQTAAIDLFKVKDCKFDQIKPEIDNMDTVEQERVAKLFEEKFDIKADSVEKTIEEGVAMLLTVLPFVMMVISKVLAKKVPVAAV
jgi:hypothetical protein